MSPATGIGVPRLIDAAGPGELCQALVAAGYHVIGPVVQDGAIIVRELSSASELPSGWEAGLEGR